MKDEEMLKKWLSKKEDKAFENGIVYACEKILNRCKSESMPILLSKGNNTFYVSINEIEEIIEQLKAGGKEWDWLMQIIWLIIFILV